MKNPIPWIKKEIISVIPAVIYFGIVFNVVYYVRGLPLPPGAVRYFSYYEMTLWALISGKLLIIANNLPIINAFHNKPLAYSIIWKFFIYMVLVVVCWLLDSLIHFYHEYKNVGLMIMHVKEEFMSPIYWTTIILLGGAFFVFVVCSEFMRILGKKQVEKILFG